MAQPERLAESEGGEWGRSEAEALRGFGGRVLSKPVVAYEESACGAVRKGRGRACGTFGAKKECEAVV